MKYKVILSRKSEEMLLLHVKFLAQVSVPAARVLKNEFGSVLKRLENNPMQFPVEEDLNLPFGKYRRAVFAKRYKAVFSITGNIVHVDAIIDCRSSLYSFS